MLLVEPNVIDRAFTAFEHKYVRRAKAWDLDDHVELWATASVACRTNGMKGFDAVYDHLRSHWQLARGPKGSLAPAGTVCETLSLVPARVRTLRLSAIADSDGPELLATAKTVGQVKTLKSGPSIMAASKLLHFVNPRLFVIVDRGMIWDGAFGRAWIWDGIRDMRQHLASVMPGAPKKWDDDSCDAFTYVAVLRACCDLIQRNPQIKDGLDRFLNRVCKRVRPPLDVSDYEGAAAEWFLLGAAELVPPGISRLASRP